MTSAPARNWRGGTGPAGRSPQLLALPENDFLGLFGDKDKGIPVEQVESLRQATAKAPVSTEIVRYVEAEHGFHCDRRPAYHEQSAKDAWRRTLEWFGAYMDGGNHS